MPCLKAFDMLECKSTESAESKTINGLSLGSLHKALEDGKLNLNRLELGLAMAESKRYKNEMARFKV